MLEKEEKQVNKELRTWRRFLDHYVLKQASHVLAEVQAYFDAKLVNVPSGRFRRECYDKACKFLKVAQRGLREHSEVIANACAMKRVVAGRTGKRRAVVADALDWENPTSHDDIRMIVAAAQWEWEIKFILPRESIPAPEVAHEGEDTESALLTMSTSSKRCTSADSLSSEQIKLGRLQARSRGAATSDATSYQTHTLDHRWSAEQAESSLGLGASRQLSTTLMPEDSDLDDDYDEDADIRKAI